MDESKCTELTVADEGMPTMQHLREQGPQERGRQRPQYHAWLACWPVVMVVAMCVLLVVLLISQEDRGQPAKADSENANSSSSRDRTQTKEQRSFDFEDPSRISREMAIEHLYRYDGMADVRDDGYEEFDNWITGERVTTLGELRRFQVLLDMYGERRDRNADSDVPEDVRESVARHIRECKDRDNDNKDSND